MTDQAAAARTHVRDAEMEALRIPGLDGATPLRAIEKVGIVGAGTMGGGIAMSFANAGIPVAIVDMSQDGLDRGLLLVRKNYDASAAKGRMSASDVEARMGLLHASLDYGDLAECDLIIEAVFEDLALKRQVCAEIAAVAKTGAVIATNTSTLDVDSLARASGRPEDFIGLHFFSPANIMRLLEVVRGRCTAPDVLATVLALASRIGKTPVVSGVCYGFIGNRMSEVYMRETEYLLLEGATPKQIDTAIEALGFAMGPCRMLDMAGIDVGAKTVIEWKKSGRAPTNPSYRVVVDELFRRGRHGQKTGVGYYRYEERTAVPDPDLDPIIEGLANAHGVIRREAIPDDEIVSRLLYAMVNEGCRILEDGIAYRPGDIDVVWTAGYGFPKDLGGPMFWAEQVGLAKIVEAILDFQVRFSAEDWVLGSLLSKGAKEGRGLDEVLAGAA
ncbi:3-hydroxyacyl-CoA dehydrogenase [Sphingopyxis sp.]|uniref:3-hydroxyacyl-CoA dehydrogenase n=1 Tax=Sphingopyxis sp. TaxID=1908224 RepID=UPI002B460C01|nr:3-hydroxyacyl-CoA dehydrogenase NAD-binding domain-containing protein [Sphingopyxis sp.]HJS09783.1 3-hydroxyacyl-CoA dehydrogenase NAD-binding domain-containing protein [Sphingopyxis sp.]